MKALIYCDICHPGIVEVEVDSVEEALKLASSDFAMDEVDCRIYDEQNSSLLIRPTGTAFDEHMVEMTMPSKLSVGSWRNDRCVCQDCLWEGDDDDCDPINDIFERVSPGESMPSGQCPLCGALCQPK